MAKTTHAKKAVVIHSGGMDSSLCLALAIRDFGCEHVVSMSVRYGQRHSTELRQAAKICRDWQVDHIEITLDFLPTITNNALIDPTLPILHPTGQAPNTLVMGRNGLLAHLGGIHAQNIGAHCIYLGVMQAEAANPGYRDCNRAYMDLAQQIIRIDLDDPSFEIRTPVINMTKKETMILGHQLGVLEYLLKETISCYEGLPHQGCQKCPTCALRNEGILQFLAEFPQFPMPYAVK